MEPLTASLLLLQGASKKEAFRHGYILKYTFSAFDIHHPSTFRLIEDNQADGVAVLGRCDKELLKVF